MLVVLCAGTLAQADQPQLAPQPGVLVLRNGRVLSGEIMSLGDRYLVTSRGRDELVVPVDSVEIQGDSLEDAYQKKRAALAAACSSDQHLALADWCLRYDLTAAAAEQLAAAKQRDPDNPAVAQFERRLRIATRTTPPTPEPRAPVRTGLSPADLDQFIRQLPPTTVERFTTVVQPLLINRCGASGCHGANCNSSFRLNHPSWSRILPRRFTQQNLYSTMQHVDKSTPDNSRLLEMATAAHGTCQKPSFQARDADQLKLLVDWVAGCAGNRAPPPNVGSPDALLMQPRGSQPPPATAAAANGVAGPPQNAASPPPAASEPVRIDAQPASHTTASGPSEPAGEPDPFDPAVFNRRYLRRAP